MSDIARVVVCIGRLSCLGALAFAACAPLAFAQNAPDTLRLKRDPALDGDLTAWFSDGARPATNPAPLPPADAAGWTTLTIPPAFRTASARLDVLDVAHSKIARLPLGAIRTTASLALNNPNALLESAWGQLIPLTPAEHDASVSQWNRWLERRYRATNGFRRIARSDALGPLLLQNAAFNNGLADWQLEINSPLAKAAVSVSGEPAPRGIPGHVVRFNLTTLGAMNWNIQFLQPLLDITSGQPYTVSFWAKADHPRLINLSANQDSKPWGGLGLARSLPITTKWRRYSFVFMASNTLPGHGRLSFILGDSLGTVDLAGVSLRAGMETAALKMVARDLQAGVGLSPASFQWAQSVRVPVKYKGKGVSGVLVTLRDEQKEYGRRALQPEDGGVAQFSDVPINKMLTVVVSDVNADGQTKSFPRMVPQDAADVVQEVALPASWNNMNTVTETSASAASRPSVSDAASSAAPRIAPVASLAAQRPKPALPSPPRSNPALLSALCVVLALLGGTLWTLNARRVRDLDGLGDVQTARAVVANRALPQSAIAAKNAPPMPALPEAAENLSGPQLVGTHGVYSGYAFALSEPRSAIGRDVNNVIALSHDDAASRRHATIQNAQGHYFLMDDGSSNGTFVNGVRIAHQVQHPLNPGDEIQVGKTRFRFTV